MSGASGLSGIPTSALPADIRQGTKAQQDDYKAAMGFEQLLVRQLVEQVTRSSPDLAGDVHADAITDAMTTAVESAGGLGLARTLSQSFPGSAS
jgi:hypothetical protein